MDTLHRQLEQRHGISLGHLVKVATVPEQVRDVVCDLTLLQAIEQAHLVLLVD